MQGVPLFVSAKWKIFHHVTDLSNYFLQLKKNDGDKVIKHWEQMKSDVVLGPRSLQWTSLGVGGPSHLTTIVALGLNTRTNQVLKGERSKTAAVKEEEI